MAAINLPRIRKLADKTYKKLYRTFWSQIQDYGPKIAAQGLVIELCKRYKVRNCPQISQDTRLLEERGAAACYVRYWAGECYIEIDKTHGVKDLFEEIVHELAHHVQYERATLETIQFLNRNKVYYYKPIEKQARYVGECALQAIQNGWY